MLTVKKGDCGIRQNDAVFLHTKNLSSLFSGIEKYDIDCFAASSCPSERENSYMPCFTVGMSYASSLASITDKPFYSCSHQKNHICAALYSAGKTELLASPFLAYHVSGGTTDICICRPSEEGVFSVQKIGGTADISCGQLIDRTGVSLGLDFPCGKHIQQLSDGQLSGNAKLTNRDGLYNFSGFQNKTEKMIADGVAPSEIARFTLDVVFSFILNSVSYFRNIHGDMPVLMSGGVMSNRQISSAVSERISDICFSDPMYSVDNSLGTAFMCAYERGMLNE